MALKEKYDLFEEKFIETWGEYKKICDELDAYRGVALENEDTISRVNKLIRQIQEKFHELYPVFVFIRERYTFSNDAMYEYNKFIDDIKKAGAIEEGRA